MSSRSRPVARSPVAGPRLDGDTVLLGLQLIPGSRWDLVWPRFGVRLELPVDVDGADWFGTGPGESYPDSHRGVLVGRYRAGIEQLTFSYAWPQESGHRSDLRRLDLTAQGEGWLRVGSRPCSARRRQPS